MAYDTRGMGRAVKGPYLATHSKLSLGLDRLLPAIAAVEASTHDLVRGPPPFR